MRRREKRELLAVLAYDMHIERVDYRRRAERLDLRIRGQVLWEVEHRQDDLRRLSPIEESI